MAAPIVIPATLGNSTIKFLDNYQGLLAAMQYYQGASLEYWFSRIYPFAEISQRDGEPIALLVKDDYYTFFDDKEKATVFFYLGSEIEKTAGNSGEFRHEISMLIWYRVPVFSKSRSVKMALMQALNTNFFRYLNGSYDNLKFIVNWEDVWRGFNVDKYFMQSTQPYDCLRVDFTTNQSFDCLEYWVSDITNPTNCN